ncbi:hypothetical protein JCM19037_1335 [Geomicrobium sp. JCM 19037]|nr:hypothetical protein JCM19037_1335 [Geomicrobium sp. JCM 19037]
MSILLTYTVQYDGFEPCVITFNFNTDQLSLTETIGCIASWGQAQPLPLIL